MQISANYEKDDILKATGVRGVGMGGAFVAVADDYSAFFWNPAGFVLQKRTNINVLYDSVYRGSQANFGINITHPLPQNMVIAATYMKTIFLASIFSNDSFYFSYASFLNESKTFSIGANLKLVNISADGYDINGTMGSVDAGFLYSPDWLGKKMKFGFFIQDLEASIQWNNNIVESIPAYYKLGTSYAFDETAVIALDVGVLEYKTDTDWSIHLGGEKWFMSRVVGNFGLRAGFLFQEVFDPGYTFTFGFSYGREDFTADYVYIPDFRTLGETHKISISYRLGDAIKEEKIQIAKQLPKEIATTDLTGKLEDLGLHLSGKYISPNKDGIMDTVRFTLGNIPGGTGNLYTEMEVFDKENIKVRGYRLIGKIPDYLEWNGLNEKAVEVNDGDYVARIRIKRDNEILWEKFKVVTVDKTPPACTVRLSPKTFAPHPSSLIKNMEIRISTKFKDIKSWEFKVVDMQGHVIKRLYGEGLTKVISWNGKDALGDYTKDGRYNIQMIFEDFAGNSYDVSEAFVVNTEIIKYSVNVENRIFKTSKDFVSFFINLSNPGKIKTWQLEIFDSENNVLRVFKNRGPGIRKVTWNGTTEKNVYVKEGRAYNYKVSVLQQSGMTTEKTGFVQAELPDFTATGIKLTLAAVRFNDKDKYLPIEEYTYLNQAAEAINRYAKDYFVFIKAYSNDYKSASQNLEISLQRAKAVEDYLVAGQGVSADRIYVVGYGDGEYATSEAKERIEEKGIRVEVELLTK